jgi:hypothetical protein
MMVLLAWSWGLVVALLTLGLMRLGKRVSGRFKQLLCTSMLGMRDEGGVQGS